jgi:putative FmdB family regulatory protein
VPTYSYACSSCGHDFDQYQAFTDDALTVCPSCGERTLRKVFSNIGVSFTGSGFYRNDSRSEASGKKTGSSTSSEPAKPKTESKPDAAPSAPAPAATGSSTSTQG